MSNLTKSLTLTSCLFLLTLALSAQGEKGKYLPQPMKDISKEKKAKPAEEDVLPADFPKFVDTGNPVLDAQKYTAAKEDWYAKNPKEAERLNGEKFGQKITKEEYDKLPPEKQKAILNNPSRFTIVE